MKIKIKGICKDLHLTSKNISLIDMIGNLRKFPYTEIHRIDYHLDTPKGSGSLEFSLRTGKKYRYEFWGKRNDEIINAIDIIKEKQPDVILEEHFDSELKIYQKLWFQLLLCLFCCMPIGLILMWYHKTSNILVRVWATIIFMLLPICGIYSSYQNYKVAVSDFQQEYESAYSSVADDFNNILSSVSESVGIPVDTQLSDEPTQPAQTEYEVGDVFESDTVKIMFIDSGDYPVDNQYLQPASGNKYIFTEFSIYNTGDNDLSIGSAAFSCYADDTDCKQATLVSSDDELIIVTSLSPGRNTKGKIFYEVPIDAESIEIEFETSLWTQDKIYFIVK